MGEGLSTLTALVGLLPTVNPLVLCQVRLAVEGLATLHARVGLGPRVHPPVLGQVRAPAEGFPTLAARVGRPAGLALLVGLRGALEGLPPLSTRGGASSLSTCLEALSHSHPVDPISPQKESSLGR